VWSVRPPEPIPPRGKPRATRVSTYAPVRASKPGTRAIAARARITPPCGTGRHPGGGAAGEGWEPGAGRRPAPPHPDAQELLGGYLGGYLEDASSSSITALNCS